MTILVLHRVKISLRLQDYCNDGIMRVVGNLRVPTGHQGDHRDRFTYWTPKDGTPNDRTLNDRTPKDGTPNDQMLNDRTPNDRTPNANTERQ